MTNEVPSAGSAWQRLVVGQGLPEGWERISARIARLYGHTLRLEQASGPFSDWWTSPAEAPDLIEASVDVHINGEHVGRTVFVWDDGWSEEVVLAEPADKIEESWAQDLGGGLWGPGLAPPGL